MLEKQNPDELPRYISLPNKKKITLYKNGDNENIYYYFRYGKKSHRGSTGKSDIQSSIEEGFRIYSEVTTGKRKTWSKGSNKFEVVCKQYLKYKEENERRKLSPRTLSEYKNNSKYLIQKFQGCDIGTLCSEKVYEDYQKWRGNYYKEHKTKKQILYKRNGKKLKGRILDHVGSVPINRELRLLVSILRYSKYNLKLLPDVEIPPYTLLDENHGKRILTETEYEKLRQYMSENSPYNWLIISFINSTGIRYPSELLRITWKNVDWKTPCVWIRNRKNPKGGQSLDTPFPLVGSSLGIIRKLWSRDNISKEPDDFVFVNDKGVQVKNIRRSFKHCLKECGIDNDVSIYSFRHRFTTNMILREDIPVVVLSKVLGHKSTQMVMKHYEQLDKDNFVKIFQDSRKKYYKTRKEGQKKKKKRK